MRTWFGALAVCFAVGCASHKQADQSRERSTDLWLGTRCRASDEAMCYIDVIYGSAHHLPA